MDPTAHGSVDDVDPAAPAPAPAARPGLGWTEIIIAAAAYVLLSIVAGVLLFAATGGIPAIPLVALTGVATLAAVAIALAPRIRSAAAVGLRSTTWRWVLVGLGAGVGIWLVNRLVVLGYMALTGDVSNPQEGLANAAAGTALELAALLLAGAVLVPFAEELLFRGILFGALRRYGVVLATIVSALVFGIAHGVNAVLPAAVLIGVVTAVLYERSRSIWPAVLVHVVNNAIAFTAAAILL